MLFPTSDKIESSGAASHVTAAGCAAAAAVAVVAAAAAAGGPSVGLQFSKCSSGWFDGAASPSGGHLAGEIDDGIVVGCQAAPEGDDGFGGGAAAAAAVARSDHSAQFLCCFGKPKKKSSSSSPRSGGHDNPSRKSHDGRRSSAAGSTALARSSSVTSQGSRESQASKDSGFSEGPFQRNGTIRRTFSNWTKKLGRLTGFVDEEEEVVGGGGGGDGQPRQQATTQASSAAAAAAGGTPPAQRRQSAPPKLVRSPSQEEIVRKDAKFTTAAKQLEVESQAATEKSSAFFKLADKGKPVFASAARKSAYAKQKQQLKSEHLAAQAKLEEARKAFLSQHAERLKYEQEHPNTRNGTGSTPITEATRKYEEKIYSLASNQQESADLLPALQKARDSTRVFNARRKLQLHHAAQKHKRVMHEGDRGMSVLLEQADQIVNAQELLSRLSKNKLVTKFGRRAAAASTDATDGSAPQSFTAKNSAGPPPQRPPPPSFRRNSTAAYDDVDGMLPMGPQSPSRVWQDSGSATAAQQKEMSLRRSSTGTCMTMMAGAGGDDSPPAVVQRRAATGLSQRPVTSYEPLNRSGYPSLRTTYGIGVQADGSPTPSIAIPEPSVAVDSVGSFDSMSFAASPFTSLGDANTSNSLKPLTGQSLSSFPAINSAFAAATAGGGSYCLRPLTGSLTSSSAAGDSLLLRSGDFSSLNSSIGLSSIASSRYNDLSGMSDVELDADAKRAQKIRKRKHKRDKQQAKALQELTLAASPRDDAQSVYNSPTARAGIVLTKKHTSVINDVKKHLARHHQQQRQHLKPNSAGAIPPQRPPPPSRSPSQLSAAGAVQQPTTPQLLQRSAQTSSSFRAVSEQDLRLPAGQQQRVSPPQRPPPPARSVSVRAVGEVSSTNGGQPPQQHPLHRSASAPLRPPARRSASVVSIPKGENEQQSQQQVVQLVRRSSSTRSSDSKAGSSAGVTQQQGAGQEPTPTPPRRRHKRQHKHHHHHHHHSRRRGSDADVESD